MNTGNVVEWESQSQQCRIGLVQDSDFAGDLDDSKINIKWTVMHIRKSYVRANKSEVQEKNLSFTQFYVS